MKKFYKKINEKNFLGGEEISLFHTSFYIKEIYR